MKADLKTARIITCEHVHAVAVIIVTINVVLAISAENVTITSTISSERLVCPGDQVNFTCETRGSDIIAWTSVEYINPQTGGTRIEFSAFDVGVIKQIDQNTVATLVSAESINEVRVLTSRLTIIVSPLYQNPSIACLHVGRLINATVSFVVPEMPGMILEAIAIELFGATGSGCVIFTQWERPNNVNDSYISHYIIHDEISNTSYIASERSRVIYLSICVAQSLFIRAFDRCNRDGAIAEVPIQFRSPLRNNKTTTTATDITDATSINPTSTGSFQSLIADAIGIGVTALIFAIIGLIAVVVICFRWIWSRVSRKGKYEVYRRFESGSQSQETELSLVAPKAAEETTTSGETELSLVAPKAAEETTTSGGEYDSEVPKPKHHGMRLQPDSEVENELTIIKTQVAEGEQKLSVIQDKVDRVMTKELEDVHQSFQDMQKHQEEKNKALMEEIQLLKVGEQKLSVIEAKVDRIITKELDDVRQSLQDVIERKEKKNEALMKEIQREIQQLKKQDTQEQEAAKSATSFQLKDPELEAHDEGKELGAVPAETTEMVETSDDREEAVEKSEMPETTDLEVK